MQKFLKELAQLWHKRPFEVSHVVLIPRLLWDEELRNQFEKEVDIWFILHNGSLWPHSAFEPLMVGISFPLLPPSSPYPWQVNRNGREWWTWAVPCLKCQNRVTFESGIICANFGSRRGHFPVCNGAWCATCFKSHPLD